jgi:hypothetical protein
MHPQTGSKTVTYTVPLLAVAADPGAAVVALPGAWFALTCWGAVPVIADVLPHMMLEAKPDVPV